MNSYPEREYREYFFKDKTIEVIDDPELGWLFYPDPNHIIACNDDVEPEGDCVYLARTSFAGLAGMGDLVLTCTGDLSRNRMVGLKIGQGMTLPDAVQGMSMVAEGVRTVKSAFALKNKLSIQATIIDETYRILYDNKPPQKALEDVMRVKISTEFSGVKGFQ